jgi:hypothetical protein
MLACGIPYDIALHDHLRHNIYPPVPELTECAQDAIDAVLRDEPAALLRLPSRNEVSAQVIVDGLRLREFIAWRRGQIDGPPNG